MQGQEEKRTDEVPRQRPTTAVDGQQPPTRAGWCTPRPVPPERKNVMCPPNIVFWTWTPDKRKSATHPSTSRPCPCVAIFAPPSAMHPSKIAFCVCYVWDPLANHQKTHAAPRAKNPMHPASCTSFFRPCVTSCLAPPGRKSAMHAGTCCAPERKNAMLSSKTHAPRMAFLAPRPERVPCIHQK